MTSTLSPLNSAQAVPVYLALDKVGPAPYLPGVTSKSRRAQTPLAADLVKALAKAEAEADEAFAEVAALVLVPIREQAKIDKAATACRLAQAEQAKAALALDDFLTDHRDEIIADAERTREDARAVAHAQADQLAACLDAVADADSLVKALADRNVPRANDAMTDEGRKRYLPGGNALARVLADLDPPRKLIVMSHLEVAKLRRGEPVAHDVDGNEVTELTDAVRVTHGTPRPRPGQ